MIGLVIAILVIEIFRTILSVQDNMRVRKLNSTALKEQSRREKEWEANRKIEMDDLKNMAQGCQLLADILKEFKKD